MKSFKSYLTEQYAGNYVCLETEDMSFFFVDCGIPEPTSGVVPPDFHCTVMYSEISVIEPERVASLLRTSGFNKPYIGKIIGFDLFDSPEDNTKCSLVAKLECPELMQAHDYLRGIGLQHSYSEYSPHITLRYGMDIIEAAKYKELLSGCTGSVTMAKFRSEPINKHYV